MKVHCPLCGNTITSVDSECVSGGPQPDGCILAQYGVRDELKRRYGVAYCVFCKKEHEGGASCMGHYP